MTLRKSVILLCSLLLCPAAVFRSHNQTVQTFDEYPTPDHYPQNYFIRPVGDALRLTGTFGELRSNHFHSGIDIKSSTGRVGQPIYAAADGFIDRIKVERSGYGNALYVKHPNGYTTVYGHLHRFAPELEDYVRQQQYEKERFEVNLYPPDGKFTFKKGEEIGKMGTTGSSTGPHLHFEIRQTSSGKVLNPLLFGLPVTDNIPPQISDMKVYVLKEDRSVLHNLPFPLTRRNKTEFGVPGDTVEIGAWRVGFGVKTYDKLNALNNNNGVYAIKMYADGQLTYSWRMDELSFAQTRYLNAHIDYPARKQYRAFFNRLFVLPGNKLSAYEQTGSNGAVSLYRDKAQEIVIKVSDFAGNESVIRFWVKRKAEMLDIPPQTFNQELLWAKENLVRYDGFYMHLPKGVLYEDLLFRYKTTPDNSSNVYSSVHHVHEKTTPAHQYFDLAIRPDNIPDELRAKAVIVECGSKRPVNCGGHFRSDGMVHTRVRAFGDYCVMVDNQPPSITPIVFSKDMRRNNTMAFRITDNFGTTGKANSLRFRGTIDGEWVLFGLDAKHDRLTHIFEQRLAAGEHTLRLTVTDDRGNEAVFEENFIR